MPDALLWANQLAQWNPTSKSIYAPSGWGTLGTRNIFIWYRLCHDWMFDLGWSNLRKHSWLSVSCEQNLAQIHTESPEKSWFVPKTLWISEVHTLDPLAASGLGWIPSNEKIHSDAFAYEKYMDPRRAIPRSCSATRRSFRLDRCKSMKTNGGLSYIEHWNRLDG